MKLRMFVCFLPVIVATPPILGQMPDQPTANKRGGPKGGSSGQQQPARQVIPAPIVNSVASPVTRNRAAEQEYTDNPVTISTVKPLDISADVKKDWMDKVNWIFAGSRRCLAYLTSVAANNS
jgi:hypothetical protein